MSFDTLSNIPTCDVYGNNLSVSHRNTPLEDLEIYYVASSTRLTNIDIHGFKIRGHDISYLPDKLENFIFDIEYFEVRNCGLREIKQKHLKAYTRLMYLNLFDNLLQVIEKDLFKHNLNLKIINLAQNMLVIVDANVFDHLKYLEILYMLYNSCIDRDGKGKTEIDILLKKVNEKCTGKRKIQDEDQKIQIRSKWKKKLLDIFCMCHHSCSYCYFLHNL